MLSIIVAIAENYAIGKNNDLLWHIPEDLKRFKRLTIGHTIIMGKKTYESLPKRPLPGRRSIVITDDPKDQFEGCITVLSIDEAIKQSDPSVENFIIGGASIYRQFLPLADRLYLTKVHRSFDGDVYFPEIDFNEWKLISKEDFPADQHNDFSYSNLVFDRIWTK
jgi:dihydrofolate reductase